MNNQFDKKDGGGYSSRQDRPVESGFGKSQESQYANWKLRQKTIWACFFAGVSAVAVASSVYFWDKYDNVRTAQITSEENIRTESENACKRSLFSLADGLQNADANMGKLLVATDNAYLGKILTQTEGIAQSAVSDIACLPIQGETAYSCAKYFNQLGDYCKALAESVYDGNQLSEEQKESIFQLRKVGQKLKKAIDLACYSEETITWTDSHGENFYYQINLDDINEETFDYPQLVYDGPFSDSVTQKTFDKKVLSHEEVEKIILQKFADYGVTQVRFVGEVDGKAKVYQYEILLFGKNYSLTTATDGSVAELNQNNAQLSTETEDSATAFADASEGLSKEEISQKCREEAQKLAKALGYDVEPIWTSKPIDDRVYITLVWKDQEKIYYPDMVKMALDASDFKVVGVDAFGYIANHRIRELPAEQITLQQALEGLPQDCMPQETQLCVVPDSASESYCYQISVEKDGEHFLVYVDAVTGRQKEVLLVIEDDLGYTVM